MADLMGAATSGDRRKFYEALKMDLVETLPGAKDYAKPGIIKQILNIDEKLDSLPKAKADSPLARAKRGA